MRKAAITFLSPEIFTKFAVEVKQSKLYTQWAIKNVTLDIHS